MIWEIYLSIFDTLTKVRTCGRGQHPGRMSRVGVEEFIFMSLVFSCFRAF